MSSERPGMTPGDPLGGPPGQPAPAPERPAGAHYAGANVPPGAFAPREPRPGPPAKEDLAGWSRRVVATLVDGLIVLAATALVLALLGVGLFADGDLDLVDGIVGVLVGVLAFAFVVLLYAPLLMARTDGQTLGKMAARCRVVRADGKPVDFWWAALREVAVKGLLLGIASSITGGLALLVDALWPLPDPQNRALHDFVADSRVVKA